MIIASELNATAAAISIQRSKLGYTFVNYKNPNGVWSPDDKEFLRTRWNSMIAAGSSPENIYREVARTLDRLPASVKEQCQKEGLTLNRSF